MKNKIICGIKSGKFNISLCNIMPYIVMLVLILMVLSSCSTIERQDDAVRIKQEKSRYYRTNMANQQQRDGTTLRGTALKIIQKTYPNSCPVSDTTTYRSQFELMFLDAKSSYPDEIEKIPIEDIDLIAQKNELLSKFSNKYNNLNWFENFNDPLDPRAIREIPVDSIFINNCPDIKDCNCNPINVALDINCPDCNYGNYFVELRGGYAVYNDKNSDGLPVGRDNYMGEIAFGYRWDSWGVGLVASSGVPVYNSITGKELYRPLLMLHGRKQFEKFLCMYPFVYGQFGFTMDVESLDLFSANECDLPDVNLPKVGLPISYGFGAGLDIPLPFCLFDISLDLGYRSVLVGETFNTLLFTNVSDSRRINMVVFRLGITLGY